jgi:hypothetical protein
MQSNGVATDSPSKADGEFKIVQRFAEQYRLKTRICPDDGTKTVPGRYGHIYEYDDHSLGVVVVPDPPRRKYWGCTRATLLEAGLTIVQDGEGEGAAVFDPADVSQSKAAIRAAGVKRKRQLSPSQREQRSAFLQVAQGRHLRSCGPLG